MTPPSSATPTSAPLASGRLHGLRCVITGGARGIGAEIARRFTAEGASVVILDRLAEEGRTTAESIGGRFIEVDLAEAGAATRAVDEGIEALGGVDVLVNSAGVLRLTPLLDITLDDWNSMFEINVGATLSTMQSAARSMIGARSGGKIINLASMAAKHGGADEAHYAASKAAVVALTRVAALEWGTHGITVNCLCPGYILTEMGAATRTDEDVATWSAYSPLGRLGEPSDVAGVAAFLASRDSDYLTGQAINVTGGMIMH